MPCLVHHDDDGQEEEEPDGIERPRQTEIERARDDQDGNQERNVPPPDRAG
jgi:hypothetical protein